MVNVLSNLITKSKIFGPLAGILTLLVFLLNLTTKLVYCSLIYISLILALNIIAEIYGKVRAMHFVIFSIAANSLLSYQFLSLDFMGLSSYLSVLVSSYIGISLFAKLNSSFSFQVRNLISLLACSLIDSAGVVVSLLNKFALDKALLIGIKDLMFKSAYSCAIAFCVLLALYLLRGSYSNSLRSSPKHIL